MLRDDLVRYMARLLGPACCGTVAVRLSWIYLPAEGINRRHHLASYDIHGQHLRRSASYVQHVQRGQETAEASRHVGNDGGECWLFWKAKLVAALIDLGNLGQHIAVEQSRRLVDSQCCGYPVSDWVEAISGQVLQAC